MQDDGNQLFGDLMRLLPDGMTANGWAVRAGVSRTVWADLKRHGNPSRRTMEKLLQAVGSSLAEFEALRIRPEAPTIAAGSAILNENGQAWRSALPPPLPVINSGPAGALGTRDSGIEQAWISRGAVIDRVARPASMAADRHAYAVTIIGNSMWPRFLPGRRVAVSPLGPISAGDDVLVILGGRHQLGDIALIKELVRQTANAILLRQHHPSVEFEISSTDVAAVHRVLGELI